VTPTRSVTPIVELRADDWVTVRDFANALKKAIGAPEWHGDSVDAFFDSMIYHDDINTLKSPYTIAIRGTDKTKPGVQQEIRLLAQLVNKRGAADQGADLEIVVLVED
jgi:hypothetical protein